MNYTIKNIILTPINILYRLSPSLALRILFRIKNGYKLNLDNPKTYNEKIQWIKLFDKDELIPICADKFTVREFVDSRGCPEILNDLIWEGYNPEEIPFDSLPKKFAIKATHGSGFNILCTDKSKIDEVKIKKQLNKWLKRKFIRCYGEWFYGIVKPRIIIEKYLSDDTQDIPIDYKIMCFNGIPKFIIVDTDRFTGHKRNIYDLDWNFRKEVSMGFKNDKPILPPKKLAEMLRYASTLSKGFRHARVDLYLVNEKIYFGEITFTNGAGFDRIMPYEFDIEMGELFKINIG